MALLPGDGAFGCAAQALSHLAGASLKHTGAFFGVTGLLIGWFVERLDLSVIVAVIAVVVVQVVADDIISVVSVGDSVVAAVWAMSVIGVVLSAGVGDGAAIRVLGADGDAALIGVAVVIAVHMAVVEVVFVVSVLDYLVTAAVAVFVIVRVVAIALLVLVGSAAAFGVIVVIMPAVGMVVMLAMVVSAAGMVLAHSSSWVVFAV